MVSAPKDVAQEEAAERPLVIGVTGHRDLVPEEVPGIEAAVRKLFQDLADRFPDRPLQVQSVMGGVRALAAVRRGAHDDSAGSRQYASGRW